MQDEPQLAPLFKTELAPEGEAASVAAGARTEARRDTHCLL